MKKYAQSITMCLGLLVMIVTFNNCSDMKFASDEPASLTKSSLSNEELNAAAVDAKLCESASGDDDEGGEDSTNEDPVQGKAKQGEQCIALCHIPPGNAAAKNTIYVGRSAIENHIVRHISHSDESIKDYLGQCKEESADESDEDDSADDSETAD